MSLSEGKLNKLLKKLNKSKNSEPSLEWLSLTRSKLEQHIRANPRSRAEHFKPRANILRSLLFKPATVIAIALVVLLGGGTSFIAQASEPGETLYPLKLAGENFSILIQVSPEAKAKLYMKYADRRLGELEKLYEKEPGNKYWQEKVAQQMNQHMMGARDNMVVLQKKPQYAEVALSFEELTERHRQRLAELENKLNTSTITIINEAQELIELNHQKAQEALQHAQDIIELNDKRHDQLRQRLEARLKLLRARQEFMQNRLNKKFNRLDSTSSPPDILVVPDEIEELKLDNDSEPKKNKTRNYSETFTGDGVYLKSNLDINSGGTENVNSNIDINNGQVISNSSVKATGTNIIIDESSTIHASSSQSIKINGKEVEIK